MVGDYDNIIEALNSLGMGKVSNDKDFLAALKDLEVYDLEDLKVLALLTPEELDHEFKPYLARGRQVERGLRLLKGRTNRSLARSLYNWENTWDARKQTKSKALSLPRGKRRVQRGIVTFVALCALFLLVESVGLGWLGSTLVIGHKKSSLTEEMENRAPYKVFIASIMIKSV
jgi:hypothetical protein